MDTWLAALLIAFALWLGHKVGRWLGYAQGFAGGLIYASTEGEPDEDSFVADQREVAPWQ